MEQDYKQALNLEYWTLAYSILEAVVAIVFGTLAGSVALLSFGLDSVAEMLSGLVLVWRLKKQSSVSSKAEEDRLERKAQKLVGVSFFLLAGYVLYEIIKMLVTSSIPEPSLPGIIIAVLALVAMPIFSYKKYNLGQKMDLNSLIADAKETLVCSLLSLALLVGLAANYFFGLWQLDPVVSLLIVLFLLREGWELLTEEE